MTEVLRLQEVVAQLSLLIILRLTEERKCAEKAQEEIGDWKEKEPERDPERSPDGTGSRCRDDSAVDINQNGFEHQK